MDIENEINERIRTAKWYHKQKRSDYSKIIIGCGHELLSGFEEFIKKNYENNQTRELIESLRKKLNKTLDKITN